MKKTLIETIVEHMEQKGIDVRGAIHDSLVSGVAEHNRLNVKNILPIQPIPYDSLVVVPIEQVGEVPLLVDILSEEMDGIDMGWVGDATDKKDNTDTKV